MQMLPETFSKNGMSYKMVQRNDKVAMYEQFSPTEQSVGYEVILVRVQKEMDVVLGGVNIHYDEKEALPSNNSFGTLAWGYTTPKAAQKKFDEITTGKIEVSINDELNEEDDYEVKPKFKINKKEKSIMANIPISIDTLGSLSTNKGGRGRKPTPVTFNGITYPSKGEAVKALIRLNMSNEDIVNGIGISLASVLCGRSAVKKESK